jgi:hypothetical protein
MRSLTLAALLAVVLPTTTVWGETWTTDTGATCRVEHQLSPLLTSSYVDDVLLWCLPPLPTHRRSVRVVVLKDRSGALEPTPSALSRVCRHGPRLRHRPRHLHQSGCCPFVLFEATTLDPSMLNALLAFRGRIACPHQPSVSVTFSGPDTP